MRYSTRVDRALLRTLLMIGSLLSFLLLACADRSTANTPAPQVDLAAASTPFAASEVLAGLPIRTCAEFQSVIAALSKLAGHDAFASVSIEAMVLEALSVVRPVCSGDAIRALVAAGHNEVEILVASWVAVNDGAALALLGAATVDESALLLRRRGQILVGQGKTKLALRSLMAALALEEEAGLRAQAAQLFLRSGESEKALSLCAGQENQACWAVELAALAKLGKRELLRRRFEEIPLHLEAEMAERVVREAEDVEDLVAGSDSPAAWLIAAARLRFPDALEKKAALLDRAVLRLDTDAEVFAELAETREALGQLPAAVAAWDRANAVSLGNTRAKMAAIRVLAESGRGVEALGRSAEIARGAKNAESFRLASLAYKYAGDPVNAVVWAERAAKNRPGNGRYVSELASRLQEVGEGERAVFILRKLLVCGVSGKPWHRHEIAAQLHKMRALEATSLAFEVYGCAPVEAAELSDYIKTPPKP